MNNDNFTTDVGENHQFPTCGKPFYPDLKDKYKFPEKQNNSSNLSVVTQNAEIPIISADLRFESKEKGIDTYAPDEDKSYFELEHVSNQIFSILRKKIDVLETKKSSLCLEDDLEQIISIDSEISVLEKRINCLNSCNTNFVGVHCKSEDKKDDSFVGLPLFCGNALCVRCNDWNSPIHRRKVSRARWLVDIFPEDVPLGYLVFTIPESLREHFLTRDRLNELFRIGVETVKDVLAPIGMLGTLHFHGEDEPGYHPHLNVVFPRQSLDGTTLRMLLPKSVLKKIRQQFLLKLLEVIPDTAKNKFIYKNPKYLTTQTNSHYKFKPTMGQKVHCLKYVLRGTDVEKVAQSEPDVYDLFVGLSGFRNVRWFGKFSNSQKGKFLEERGLVAGKLDSSAFSDNQTVVPLSLGDGKAKLFDKYEHPDLGYSSEFPKYHLKDLNQHWDWLHESHKQLLNTLIRTYDKALKTPHIKPHLVNWIDTYDGMIKSSNTISDGPRLVLASEELDTLLRSSGSIGGINEN